MSLVPRFSDPWRSSFWSRYPDNWFHNDHFGLDFNHNLFPDFPIQHCTTFEELNQRIRERHQFIRNEFQNHPLLSNKNYGFEVSVDVHQFKPNEISVKVVENIVIVQAKHEERRDDQGLISREFSRRFTLPSGYDVNKIESVLSSEGYLTVKAPPPPPRRYSVERFIPVQQTGKAR